MANEQDKYLDNVDGEYYVDTQCIDCDFCRRVAPNNFTSSKDGGYSVVYKQPENKKEEEQCQTALEHCPVDAIGNNG